MDKVCVFCGNPPQNKNKEHILPKWLMKLTGTENKKMSVGTNWKTQKEIVFNFSSFTFPSCTKCNTDFAEVESLVKPTVEKILRDDYLATDELIRLLDWFDKIRISLWLAIQYHNKSTFNMEPKYYINTRLALKDRFLAVTNCYDNYIGLKWTGANTLCFITNPSCVTLKINNVIFTSCSSDFVVSRQLGFPYASHIFPNPNSHLTDFLMQAGEQEQQTKFFKSPLYPPNVIVSQPIFGIPKSIFEKRYDNDYVRNNSYDYDKGVGKIFITHDNTTYPLEIDEEISFISSKPNTKQVYKFNKPTIEFQLELLLSIKYNLFHLNDEQRKEHFKHLEYIIEYSKEQIRQYNY
jgi:hypothetical protein